MPKNADRLGRRLPAGLTVIAFVVWGTGLLATCRHAWPGAMMRGAGMLMLAGQILLDLRRR